MSQFFTGPRRDWSKVGSVSQAQFEGAHGSLEQDFDHKEQLSPIDRREWSVNGQDRILKQAPRLRILEAGPISLALQPRTGAGAGSVVAFDTAKQTVNAAILHLPIMKMAQQNTGTRLDDALAYYQMQDPSPLNPSSPASDARLTVPLWSKNPDNCFSKMSMECTCCPPSGV